MRAFSLVDAMETDALCRCWLDLTEARFPIQREFHRASAMAAVGGRSHATPGSLRSGLQFAAHSPYEERRMAVPTYEEFMLPLLRRLADGDEHKVGDLREVLADEFALTPSDRALRIPSGLQTLLATRVGWAKTYMAHAGLLEAPRRGVYRITALGKTVLAEQPGVIDKAFLRRFESFRAFVDGRGEDQSPGATAPTPPQADVASATIPVPEATPEEQLEAAHRKIRQRLESEVLAAVKAASPQFFEKLVVELLVKMGYGGSLADAGQALGRTGDGGIDGIIKEDHLGLDVICVQAKLWTGNVGSSEVRDFAGSLMQRRAQKGVFITTSGFTRDATVFVSQIQTKIVLIDGVQLAALMVENGVGVATVTSLEVKRLDMDYFSEE